MNICDLIVSVGQEFKNSLAVLFWLVDSHEVAVFRKALPEAGGSASKIGPSRGCWQEVSVA